MQAQENWQMKVSKNLQKWAYLLNQTMSSGVLSVKCYIRNSFGQHVSCVDLVQSDGKDDFLISLWHKFDISITFCGLLTSFRGIKYLKVAECVGLTVKKRTKSTISRHWERLCWWCTHSWAADGYLTVLTLLSSVSTRPRNQKEIEKGSLLQGHGGDMDVCTQESSVVCVCMFVCL